MKICIPDKSRISEAANAFLATYPSGGVFGLQGDLGVGKTTWVKAVIAELCARSGKPIPRITSPSFVIHQNYAMKPRVDHFDLYRLEIASDADLIEIGFWEAVDSSQAEHGYCFVEWPEKATSQNLNLTSTLKFSFDSSSETRRWIEIFK
ncbi:tRNA (adenosine(37)-N6)-threonylcarbamoyltransferase complex ATPase subunit type 1 TsaE [bacterium]|nr:tRNA (adenosine(37)-N6)-threonylcarbamoyltransferase complex ATPase subunit type 1 TsaE [bacterium]NBX81729.1 tRNA (adenosine(37)-N6)-threonylcarbamoyltransferase complex ATPase subunit type 1 TsaE [bacterium]